MQQEVQTGKKKGIIFTRPKTFAAQLGGRRPGVIYAVSPTLKKQIRETKDPLEKSMLANSGWRGEASLVKDIKTRHTAFLQEMDDRKAKILEENNKKRAERAASMHFAKSAGVLPKPKQPSVVRELFPVEPRFHAVNPGGPQIPDFLSPQAPSPTQRPVQHPVHPVPQLYPNPIQHTVQPFQYPVQNVPQPFHYGGHKEEPIVSMDAEDLLDHQPRAGAVPVAQSSAHFTDDLSGIFNSMDGSKGDMEQFSQIISSLADAYRRLDEFIKSKK